MNKKIIFLLILVSIIFPIILANICFNKISDIERFNVIIEKFYLDSLNEELNFESMKSFKKLREDSKNIFVPYYNCIMGNTDNFNVDITKELQPLKREYEELMYLSELEDFIYVSEDMEFLIDQVINEKIKERILANEIDSDIKWVEKNNILYLNLNDFTLKQNYYEIIIDDVPFRIDLDSTVMTFDVYINQVIKNKNVFIIESIERNRNYIIYNVKDVLLNECFKITCYLDIFNNIVDMKIDLPFILGNSKFCYLLE